MTPLETSSIVWILTALQALGFASTWLARVSEGSPAQSSCQSLFLVCLFLLGLATAASLAIGPATCMSCGFTLGLMVVAATCDFRASRRAEVY